MKNLVSKLLEKGLTIGSIESLTGGLFASLITSVPGASKVYKGSLVTYAASEKINLLSMDPATIEKYGVVSSEVAFDMARLGREVLGVDIAVSFTGNAGPTTEPGGQPVGKVFIGIAFKDTIVTYEEDFKGERNEIREQCVNTCINHLMKFLNL